MTNTPDQMVNRPNPSSHWLDSERVKILSCVDRHPGHDGVFHARRIKIRRPGMGLVQMETEGLLEFVPLADVPGESEWRLTAAGRTFLAEHG